MAEIGGVLSASSGATRSRPMKAVRFVLFSDYLVLALTALYVAALWFVVPEIVSPTNLNDIFLQVLPLFVAAMGVMMVLLVAQIDLSATSIMAMSCVVGASIMTSQDGYLAGQTWAPIVAVLAIVAIGLLIGAPERRLHHRVRHSILPRHADDDDVLQRRGDLVHRRAYKLRIEHRRASFLIPRNRLRRAGWNSRMRP